MPNEGFARYVAQINCNCTGGCTSFGDLAGVVNELTNGPANPDDGSAPYQQNQPPRVPWNNTVRHNCESSNSNNGSCLCAVQHKDWFDLLEYCDKEYFCNQLAIPEFY